MMQLDVDALNAAVFSVARTLKWERAPVDVDEIGELSGKLAEVAKDFADYLEGQGRDPNIVTRAVLYLGHHHALPIGESTAWFRLTLEPLIELACPNTMPTNANAAFYRDIEEGIAQARADLEE